MLRFIIGWLLVATGCFSFGWSMAWMMMGDERWWLRFGFAFGMIMLGLWYAGNKDD